VAATAPAAPAPAASAAASHEPQPQPVASAASARFDPLAEFDRVVAGQTSGFAVEARPAQSRLRIGRDKLSFSITSQREGYLTVFVLGPDGSLMRLFPNSETPRVQVKAGQTLRLPPGGIGIEASEPAGTEHFLAIVSAMPRNLDALGGSLEGGYLTLPATDALGARMAARAQAGVPLLMGSADGCTQARCDDFGATRFVLEVTR